VAQGTGGSLYHAYLRRTFSVALEEDTSAVEEEYFLVIPLWKVPEGFKQVFIAAILWSFFYPPERSTDSPQGIREIGQRLSQNRLPYSDFQLETSKSARSRLFFFLSPLIQAFLMGEQAHVFRSTNSTNEATMLAASRLVRSFFSGVKS
jgi:hypothetical protein